MNPQVPRPLYQAIKQRHFDYNPHTQRYICTLKLTNDFQLRTTPCPSKTQAMREAAEILKNLFDFHYHCLETKSFMSPVTEPIEGEGEYVLERWYRSGIDAQA